MNVVGTDKELKESQVQGGCTHCDIVWRSTALAHCSGYRGSGCHETFSSDTAFFAHRRNGKCRDPRKMIVKNTGKPMLEFEPVKQWWRYPGSNDTWS